MKKAVIRLGPLITPDIWEDRTLVREGRWYYGHPSHFQIIPGADVRVDHDGEQSVGKLLDQPFRWSDGDGEWLACRAEITDAPAWLKAGTAASIGFAEHDAITTPFGAGTRFGGGLIREVSLVSPNEQPREKLAKVVLLRNVEPVALTRELALDELERRTGMGEDVHDVVADLVSRLPRTSTLRAAFVTWQSPHTNRRRRLAA